MLDVKDISAWRERIFASLLAVALIVGGLSTLVIIPLLIHQGKWQVALADTIAILWIFAIWRLKHLSYAVRVQHFLWVVFVLAIVLLVSIGPASMNYLLAPPMIAAILLGLRPAMLAIALGALSLVGLGAADYISLSVPGWGHAPLQASLVAALNYATIGVMLTLTCSSLLQGLSRSLGDVHTFASTLEASETNLRNLNNELELTSAAVARLNDMVLIVKSNKSGNMGRAITFANDAFLRRTGYTREQIIGSNLGILVGAETDPAVSARISEAMTACEPCKAEAVNYTRTGEAFWVEVEVVPFTRSGERATHWVVVGRDVSERRAAAAAINRLAFYDVLTGLPNRRLLMDRLGAVVDRASLGGAIGAVLYLDLDNFKDVNDARGHAIGDALLGHAARRLEQVAGASDTVARIGGDEFVVLLEGLGADPVAAARVALETAGTIRDALAVPLDLDGQTCHVRTSIGVTLACGAGASAHDLLREADTAMYRAKAGGRNGVVLFEAAMLDEAQHKVMIGRELGRAFDHGELGMHLQLQVDPRGVPAGAELLMRWQRADGTMVRPDIFIPIAESSGMIVALGRWVLQQACEAWLALQQAGHQMPLSINVSPLQFRQPDFVEQVRSILARTGVPARELIFEVTEGLLIEDIGQTIARMHELAALGIRFSIDDFGTGYSSLAYLKKMPLYEVKIDKSFMHGIPHDLNGTAIVQAILAMARHLGLRVVAEGIETEAQARYLAGHGVDMQGFLYHRPMPLAQLLERLDNAALAAA